MSPENSTVLINGKAVTDKAAWLFALKSTRYKSAQHSHPTEKIDCEINFDDEKLRLWIAQDSYDDEEYWVFFPEYYYTQHNEIGRFYSDRIDLKNP